MLYCHVEFRLEYQIDSLQYFMYSFAYKFIFKASFETLNLPKTTKATNWLTSQHLHFNLPTISRWKEIFKNKIQARLFRYIKVWLRIKKTFSLWFSSLS